MTLISVWTESQNCAWDILQPFQMTPSEWQTHQQVVDMHKCGCTITSERALTCRCSCYCISIVIIVITDTATRGGGGGEEGVKSQQP